MAHGTHDFEDDPRNERILVWVNGELVPRERAVVETLPVNAMGKVVRRALPALLDG